MSDPDPLPEFDRLWDYSRPDRTEAAFRELLPRARDAGDPAYLGALLTQIARTQGLQRQFEAAHRTLDEVERLLAEAGDGASQGPLAVMRVRYLLERGRVFNSSGKPEAAVPLFLQAWEAAREAAAESYALDAAHMLGIAAPPDEALEWNRKAIGLAEASSDPKVRRWLGPLYNNTGWTLYDRQEYPEALALLERAREVYAERGTPAQVRIARYSIAKTLRALGRVPEALAIQEALCRDLEQAGEEDGYVCEEMGECLLLLDREAEARPWFRKAGDLLEGDLAESEPERLRRLRELAGR